MGGEGVVSASVSERGGGGMLVRGVCVCLCVRGWMGECVHVCVVCACLHACA